MQCCWQALSSAFPHFECRLTTRCWPVTQPGEVYSTGLVYVLSERQHAALSAEQRGALWACPGAGWWDVRATALQSEPVFVYTTTNRPMHAGSEDGTFGGRSTLLETVRRGWVARPRTVFALRMHLPRSAMPHTRFIWCRDSLSSYAFLPTPGPEHVPMEPTQLENEQLRAAFQPPPVETLKRVASKPGCKTVLLSDTRAVHCSWCHSNVTDNDSEPLVNAIRPWTPVNVVVLVSGNMTGSLRKRLVSLMKCLVDRCDVALPTVTVVLHTKHFNKQRHGLLERPGDQLLQALEAKMRRDPDDARRAFRGFQLVLFNDKQWVAMADALRKPLPVRPVRLEQCCPSAVRTAAEWAGPLGRFLAGAHPMTLPVPAAAHIPQRAGVKLFAKGVLAVLRQPGRPCRVVPAHQWFGKSGASTFLLQVGRCLVGSGCTVLYVDASRPAWPTVADKLPTGTTMAECVVIVDNTPRADARFRHGLAELERCINSRRGDGACRYVVCYCLTVLPTQCPPPMSRFIPSQLQQVEWDGIRALSTDVGLHMPRGKAPHMWSVLLHASGVCHHATPRLGDVIRELFAATDSCHQDDNVQHLTRFLCADALYGTYSFLSRSTHYHVLRLLRLRPQLGYLLEVDAANGVRLAHPSFALPLLAASLELPFGDVWEVIGDGDSACCKLQGSLASPNRSGGYPHLVQAVMGPWLVHLFEHHHETKAGLFLEAITARPAESGVGMHLPEWVYACASPWDSTAAAAWTIYTTLDRLPWSKRQLEVRLRNLGSQVLMERARAAAAEHNLRLACAEARAAMLAAAFSLEVAQTTSSDWQAGDNFADIVAQGLAVAGPILTLPDVVDHATLIRALRNLVQARRRATTTGAGAAHCSSPATPTVPPTPTVRPTPVTPAAFDDYDAWAAGRRPTFDALRRQIEEQLVVTYARAPTQLQHN